MKKNMVENGRRYDTMDIVIYTTAEKLVHKKGENEEADYFYWYMSRPPKNFKVGDKVYFAVNNEIKGSFECYEFNPEKDEYGDPKTEETICWDKDSWKDETMDIQCSSFRGFRYKWW